LAPRTTADALITAAHSSRRFLAPHRFPVPTGSRNEASSSPGQGLTGRWAPLPRWNRYPNRSILSSIGYEDTPASAAWSTNTAWSHDVDEVLGTHKVTTRGLFSSGTQSLRREVQEPTAVFSILTRALALI